MKRTYIKHGIWHLGGTKKQKGGFLPSLGALARPLLVSAGGDVGREVLKGLANKFLGGWGFGGRGSGRRRQRVKMFNYA